MTILVDFLVLFNVCAFQWLLKQMIHSLKLYFKTTSNLITHIYDFTNTELSFVPKCCSVFNKHKITGYFDNF